jgi:four helix bundle protein
MPKNSNSSHCCLLPDFCKKSVQQVRRASASIPANIAEGCGRRSAGDYSRFLNISQGSINELQTHLILGKRVGLCQEEDITSIISLLQEETRMISSLLASCLFSEQLSVISYQLSFLH